MDEASSSVSQRHRKLTHVALEERVAVSNLRLIASSAAAKMWKPMGTVSLRTILADIILCAEDGKLVSLWAEEAPNYAGRRYSGPQEMRKGEPLLPHFKQLQAKGVNPSTMGRSLFGFPGYIRRLARSGLQDLFVLDLVNCHMVVLHRRHPSLQHLAHYVENRDQVLASIPASRAQAKELLIRLLYGGSVTAWCQEHSVDPAALPEIVWHFRADMVEGRRLDLQSKHLFGPESAGKLQYLLNTVTERQAIDAVERLLFSRGATLHAFEHDGLCFTLQGVDLEELTQACSTACGFLVTIERAKGFESCLQELKQLSGVDDWRPSADDWERMERLVARARTEPLTSHNLFAEVLLNEENISDEIPWPLKDLFRLCPQARELIWYDTEQAVWQDAAGGNGSMRLKHYSTMMLQRRLATYHCRKARRFELEEARHDFGNRSVRDGIESCLRSHLTVAVDFALDPESSRQCLNFAGRAWDRELEDFGHRAQHVD